MADVVVCWGPECGAVVEQTVMGRPRRYHSPTCRTRAHRRGGGKSPEAPYPPLEPGEPFKATGYGRPPKPKAPKPPRLTQDAASSTVVSGSEQPAAVSTREAPADGRPGGSDAAGKAQGTPRDSVQPPAVATAGKAPASDPASPPRAAAPGSPKSPAPSSEEAPSATVTQLHIAVTEDSTLPVEIKVHPMVAAYKADLEQIGLLETRKGQQVLTMAEKLVSSATSPAAAANLSKELERLMDSLVQDAPENQVLRDPSVAIRERTIAKLRAVQGGQEATG